MTEASESMPKTDMIIRIIATIAMIVGTIMIVKFCRSLVIGMILWMALVFLHGLAWLVTMTDEEIWD